MTQQEVIKAIMAYYNLNGSALAYELGMQPSRINFIASGRTKNITRSVYRALLKRFPALNPKFILEGTGEMHNENMQPMSEVTVAEMVELILQQYQLEPHQLANMLGWDVQTISLMRSGSAYRSFSTGRIRQLCSVFADLNPKWLKTGRDNMFIGTRVIDESLPLPKPYISYRQKKKEVSKKKEATKSDGDFDQAKVNRLLLEQLTQLRKEVAELRELQNSPVGLVADDINKNNK